MGEQASMEEESVYAPSSPAGDDDEIEEDLVWMNYRQHFFSSMLISKTPFKEARLSSIKDNLTEARLKVKQLKQKNKVLLNKVSILEEDLDL